MIKRQQQSGLYREKKLNSFEANKIQEKRSLALPITVRTENNGILISLASESAGSIVKSVAIGSWASSLENGRIERRLTCVWVSKLPTAAILVESKRLTCALACNHTPSIPPFSSNHLKLFWTPCFISVFERISVLSVSFSKTVYYILQKRNED